MTPPLVKERVLSTLDVDGKRRWLEPKLSKGRFLRRRRAAGWALIALFVALPFVRIGGRPALLLDLMTRELSVFGLVLKPSDGYLLMLFGLTIVLAVFLVTALFGRVWCGWGCPQTVYLEFVFRPIDRWLDRKKPPARRLIQWSAYVAISFVLSNVFLAYFVGVDRLAAWVLHAPAEHLGGFLVVIGTTALMVFDFAYFREQACILACPYGRLQTALLDRQSLIVGYDARRGEPRSQRKKRLPVLQERGDCVDCGACVATCPTGIDIRDGLQMECIGCAQCIDACDTVMDKLGMRRGLIGYTSQELLAGNAKRVWRARTVMYPLLLAVVAGLFVWSIGHRDETKVWVDRVQGPTFVQLPDGRIASQVRLHLENGSNALRRYTISLDGDVPDVKLRAGVLTFHVRAHGTLGVPLFVDTSRADFVHGKRRVALRVADDRGEVTVVVVTLLGPDGGER